MLRKPPRPPIWQTPFVLGIAEIFDFMAFAFPRSNSTAGEEITKHFRTSSDRLRECLASSDFWSAVSTAQDQIHKEPTAGSNAALLKKGNEVALWRAFRNEGSLDAREALISQYAHLVRLTVSRFVTKMPDGLEKDDLVSAGVVGLVKAVDQFDEQSNLRFENYAIALIRGAMLDMLRREDWVPRDVRRRLRAIEHAFVRLELLTGRPASVEEVAEELGIAEADIAALLNTFTLAKSTAESNALKGAYVRAYSDVAANIAILVEAEVASLELRRLISRAVDSLNYRERLVIALYYFEGSSFREIASTLRVREHDVYAIHNKAMTELRSYLSERTHFPYPARDNVTARWLLRGVVGSAQMR